MARHAVDTAAAHLGFQHLDRQPQFGRKQSASRVITPSVIVTAANGITFIKVSQSAKLRFASEGGNIA
jgi:hypothetical protein